MRVVVKSFGAQVHRENTSQNIGNQLAPMNEATTVFLEGFAWEEIKKVEIHESLAADSGQTDTFLLVRTFYVYLREGAET